jgi:hypothetical protein
LGPAYVCYLIAVLLYVYLTFQPDGVIVHIWAESVLVSVHIMCACMSVRMHVCAHNQKQAPLG